MGRVIDWLKAQGLNITGPADHKALIEKVESAVGGVWLEIDRLDGLPIGEVDADEVRELQKRVSKMQRGLFDGMRYGHEFRTLMQQAPTRRRLDEAVRFLTGSEVRIVELVGRLAVENAGRVAVERQESERGKGQALARWSRLVPVKEWAFEQRRNDPPPRSRAAVIRRILPEVKERARAAGEALTGDDPAVTRTVTKWFRDAGIK